MVRPLYYLKDDEGHDIGIVLSPQDYQTLLRAAYPQASAASPGIGGGFRALLATLGEVEVIPSAEGKPEGLVSAPAPKRPVSDVVIEDRIERDNTL